VNATATKAANVATKTTTAVNTTGQKTPAQQQKLRMM